MTYKLKLKLSPEEHIKLLKITGFNLQAVLEDYCQRILSGQVEPEEIHNAVMSGKER